MKKIFMASALIGLLLLNTSCTKQENSDENKTENTQAVIQTTTQTQSQTQGHIHVYNLETTLEASCNSKGVITYTCECGDTYTGDIPQLEHDIQNGECVMCKTVFNDKSETTEFYEGMSVRKQALSSAPTKNQPRSFLVNHG